MAVVAAALLPVGAVDERPLHLVAPGGAGPVLGVFFHKGGGATLSHLDPPTLETEGTALAIDAPLASSFSPDRSALAFATRASRTPVADTLRIVDLDTMAPRPETVALGGQAMSLLWARPDRVVALLNGRGALTPETIDIADGRVTRGRPLQGLPFAFSQSSDALVVLLAPANRIGAARLAVVRTDSVRSVTLDRIRAGSIVSRKRGAAPVPTHRVPGLAVDPEGGRAYVVDASGTVAVVDLRRGTVSYRTTARPQSPFHRLAAWLEPAAEAKGFDGPTRTAVWLGDGRLAVVGSDETIRRVAGRGWVAGSQPSGLEIVDTEDWTVRMIDPGASSVAVADGLLLATGSSWTSETNRPAGIGLVGYGPDLTPKLHLYERRAVFVFAVAGGRAYVSSGGKQLDVVDLGAGAIVARRGFAEMPRLLVPTS